MRIKFSFHGAPCPQPVQLSFLVSVLLILMAPFISGWLFLIPFAIQLIRIFIYDEHTFMGDIAFLVNFSSLFIIPHFGAAVAALLVAAAVWYTFRRKVFSLTPAMVSLWLLLIYFLFRANGKLTDYIFISSSLIVVFLMSSVCTPADAVHIAKRFIAGIFTASVYGYIFRGSYALAQYIAEDVVASRDYMDAFRFRSIFLDSNYYSCALILGMALIIQLYLVKQIRLTPSLLLLNGLCFFGIATYSRTFFIMFVALIFLSVFLLFRAGKKVPAFSLLLGFIAAFLLALSGKISALEVILSRILSVKNLHDLTSGRNDQLRRYARYVFSHWKTTVIGDGLGARLLGRLGSHNLYMEILYFLGVIGFLLLSIYALSLLWELYRKRRFRCPVKYWVMSFFPLGTLGIIYFTLQGILMTSTYIQLFVALSASLLPQFLLTDQDAPLTTP